MESITFNKECKKNTLSKCSEHKRKNCDVCKYMSPYEKDLE